MIEMFRSIVIDWGQEVKFTLLFSFQFQQKVGGYSYPPPTPASIAMWMHLVWLSFEKRFNRDQTRFIIFSEALYTGNLDKISFVLMLGRINKDLIYFSFFNVGVVVYFEWAHLASSGPLSQCALFWIYVNVFK